MLDDVCQDNAEDLKSDNMDVFLCVVERFI